jgi:hypothetical protein
MYIILIQISGFWVVAACLFLGGYRQYEYYSSSQKSAALKRASFTSSVGMRKEQTSLSLSLSLSLLWVRVTTFLTTV